MITWLEHNIGGLYQANNAIVVICFLLELWWWLYVGFVGIFGLFIIVIIITVAERHKPCANGVRHAIQKLLHSQFFIREIFGCLKDFFVAILFKEKSFKISLNNLAFRNSYLMYLI